MKDLCIPQSKYAMYVPYEKGDGLNDDGKWAGDLFIMLVPLKFKYDDKEFETPSGFVFDIGSVPKIARGSVQNNDESTIGFAGHDWQHKAIDNEWKFENKFTKKESDNFLYDVIRYSGQSWYISQKTYWSVRAGAQFVSFQEDAPIVDKEYLKWAIKTINEMNNE